MKDESKKHDNATLLFVFNSERGLKLISLVSWWGSIQKVIISYRCICDCIFIIGFVQFSSVQK